MSSRKPPDFQIGVRKILQEKILNKRLGIALGGWGNFKMGILECIKKEK